MRTIAANNGDERHGCESQVGEELHLDGDCIEIELLFRLFGELLRLSMMGW